MVNGYCHLFGVKSVEFMILSAITLKICVAFAEFIRIFSFSTNLKYCLNKFIRNPMRNVNHGTVR